MQSVVSPVIRRAMESCRRGMSGWRRSKRGNLYLAAEDLTLIVFRKDGGWAWSLHLICHPPHYAEPDEVYPTEEDARRAVLEVWDEMRAAYMRGEI